MSTSAMYISPQYEVAHWAALDLSNELDWKKAVAILQDRMNGRFFDIVDQIQDGDFSGFAVLRRTACSSESLQQFKEGADTTPYKAGRRYFEDFLTQTSFGKYFDKTAAGMFYDQFRCGILHQAEIKKSSKVHRYGELVKLTPDGQGLKIVNRKEFHAELHKVFAAYLGELSDGTATRLRENFRTEDEFHLPPTSRALVFPGLVASVGCMRGCQHCRTPPSLLP